MSRRQTDEIEVGTWCEDCDSPIDHQVSPGDIDVPTDIACSLWRMGIVCPDSIKRGLKLSELYAMIRDWQEGMAS